VHMHLQGGEKKFLGVIHREKFLSKCTPAHQVHPKWSKSQFLGNFLLCQEDLELELVVLDRLLDATTRKRLSTF